ncbi:hypothetical protein ES703_100627 [subsurface metagenome]
MMNVDWGGWSTLFFTAEACPEPSRRDAESAEEEHIRPKKKIDEVIRSNIALTLCEKLRCQWKLEKCTPL